MQFPNICIYGYFIIFQDFFHIKKLWRIHTFLWIYLFLKFFNIFLSRVLVFFLHNFHIKSAKTALRLINWSNSYKTLHFIVLCYIYLIRKFDSTLALTSKLTRIHKTIQFSINNFKRKYFKLVMLESIKSILIKEKGLFEYRMVYSS